MGKNPPLNIVAFVLCLCLLSPALWASSMHLPEEICMRKAQGQTDNPEYSPVRMPHQKHVSQGCDSCHHSWEDRSNPPKKCTSSGCHDLIGASGSKMQETEAAFHAYHDRESTRSCMGCHIEKSEAEQPGGPHADCAGCHAAKR